jgi:hypothetical protein
VRSTGFVWRGLFWGITISDVRKVDELEALIELIRAAILTDNAPLDGIVWLLRELRFTDRFNFHRLRTIVDDRSFRRLAGRCWEALTGADRRAAALLLESLDDWHTEGLAEIESHANILGTWLEEVVPESAGGLEWLLNDIGHMHKPLTQMICGHANPQRVAGCLRSINLKDGYVWGQLLRVLAQVASRSWVEQLRSSLHYGEFLALADKAYSGDLFYVCELAEGVMYFRRDISLEMVKRISSKIGAEINRAPATAFSELSDLFWHVLGYFPLFLAPRTPSKQQRDTARAITRHLCPEKVASGLSRTSRPDIPNFARLLDVLWEVDPSKARSIVRCVNVELLSLSTCGLWGRPDHDLKHLLGVLARTSDRQPAKALIELRGSEIQKFIPIIAIINPDLVVEALQAGASLDLEVADGFKWLRAAAALYEISKRDSGLAISVIQDNLESIIKGLGLRQSNQCEDLDTFVLTFREIAPNELLLMLSRLDPGLIEANWSARLRGGDMERRSVALLVSAAGQATGKIADAAGRLQKRFPSIVRLAQQAEEQTSRRRPRRVKKARRNAAKAPLVDQGQGD